jgi:octaprenyl-diphosphate synthase
MEGGSNGDEELAHGTALLRASGALDDTIARARTYAQRAIDALGPFPGGKAKAALVEAAEFAVARGY